jgi:hypothetical protein
MRPDLSAGLALSGEPIESSCAAVHSHRLGQTSHEVVTPFT